MVRRQSRGAAGGPKISLSSWVGDDRDTGTIRYPVFSPQRNLHNFTKQYLSSASTPAQRLASRPRLFSFPTRDVVHAQKCPDLFC